MKKIIIILGIVAVVLVGIFGFKKDSSTKIGAVISLTGFAAPWGEYAKNGMELEVKEINQNGGNIKLVIEDDGTEGAKAVSAYNKLISFDKVDSVIGGVFDFTLQPLIPLALQNKKQLISAGNFRIPGSVDLNEYSYVMLPEFSKVIEKLDGYLKKEKIQKLAVVHFKSSFGNEIAKTLEKLAGTIVNEEYGQIGNNDFRTTIIKLKAQGVDAVFLDMVGDDPVNFVKQSRQLGFNPKMISYNGVADSFEDKSLLEGMVVLNWEVPSKKFAELYKKEYGIEPTKSAEKYYDAVYVLAEGKNIEGNSFKTPNSVVTFTKDHTVETVPVEIQVIKNGVAIPY